MEARNRARRLQDARFMWGHVEKMERPATIDGSRETSATQHSGEEEKWRDTSWKRKERARAALHCRVQGREMAMGNPWVPANSMGTGLSKISNSLWVRVFLMDVDIFHGCGFRMTRRSGFVLIAISRHEARGWLCASNRRRSWLEDACNQNVRLKMSLVLRCGPPMLVSVGGVKEREGGGETVVLNGPI